MGASVVISRDMTLPSHAQRISQYLNTIYWEALGDFFDEVFAKSYSHLQEKIKPEDGEYFKFYTFEELNQNEFNLAVKLIRQCINETKNPTVWQEKAIDAWKSLIERHIYRDKRYKEDLIK